MSVPKLVEICEANVRKDGAWPVATAVHAFKPLEIGHYYEY